MKTSPFLIAMFLLGVISAESSVFEIRRVEPRGGAKTTAFRLENAGRVDTLRLSNEVLLDRSAITGVRAITEQVAVTSGRNPERKPVPAIEIAFTNAGRKRFAEVTKNLPGKQIGVVMDGKLVAAPIVPKTPPGGTVTLTGGFTRETAEALARKVNAGK